MEKQQVKASLFDKLPLLDKNRAAKFIIYGIIIAILFGLMMMISRSVAVNAYQWEALADQENELSYWNGLYGYNDFIEKQEEIDRITFWMAYQDVIFMNIARVGVNVGLVFVLIGFLSFAVMVIFAVVDLATGYIGKDLVINEFIYNSFVLITLGSLGIAGAEKIFGSRS